MPKAFRDHLLNPWLWALLLGGLLLLALPGATAWQGDQASVIQAALNANAAGRPAAKVIALETSGRVASPVAIWFYQLLLLFTASPLWLSFWKNLLFLAGLLCGTAYLARRAEIPALPLPAILLLLPQIWLVTRPLDDAALPLIPALFAFGATLGFCAEATDHPKRELLIALLASLACAAITLTPALPLVTFGAALLLAPPPTLLRHHSKLRAVGIFALLLALAHFAFLVRLSNASQPIPVGRSFLACLESLPRILSSWKLSQAPTPQILASTPHLLQSVWLAGEYLTFALALMALAAGFITLLLRRHDARLSPFVLAGLLALPTLAAFLLFGAFLRKGCQPRDLLPLLPQLLTLLMLGFHSLKRYLRLELDVVRGTWHTCAIFTTCAFLAFLCLNAGDDWPEHFGSTLGAQWQIARQLQIYENTEYKPLVFNYIRCFQYNPKLLNTLRALANKTNFSAPPPDLTPTRIYLRQAQDGTGLLAIDLSYN